MKLRVTAVCAVIVALVASVAMLAQAQAAPTTNKVLIFGPSSVGAEAAEATALGFDVETVDSARWRSMTTSDFRAYRAIVIGDTGSGNGDLATLEATASVWGPAVDGNTLIIGTDQTDHASQGGRQLNASGMKFVTDQPTKVGAFISLSESYDGASPGTQVKMLDGIDPQGFTVASAGCYNTVHITAQHPALDQITDATLSNWSCSVHEFFDSFPARFQVLAVAENLGSSFVGSDGRAGAPYILASGTGIRGFPLSATPTYAEVPAGQTHTITGQLLDAQTRQPVAGTYLRAATEIQSGAITVRSPLSCSTTLCNTDAAGQVQFSYTSTTQKTDTVVVFRDKNTNDVPDVGEEQVRVQVKWTKPAIGHLAILGDSYSSGEGAPPYDQGTDNKGGVIKRGPNGFFVERRNKCHRSPLAWGRLLPAAKTSHLACSGAKIGDLYSGQYPGTADSTGQISRLLRLGDTSAVNSVALTIGGNDIDFAGIIADCFYKECLKQADKKEIPAAKALLKPVTRALRDIKQATLNNATVVLVGYPEVIPRRGEPQMNCGWLEPVEQDRAIKLLSALNSTLKQAAADAGARFADVADTLDTHELCTSDSWMVPVGDVINYAKQENGHPNADGQQAISDRVLGSLG